MQEPIYFEGKKFISARQAADLVGYVPDYVGQLARLGKIKSRLVGRNRFVLEESILEHKRENISSDRFFDKHKEKINKNLNSKKNVVFLKSLSKEIDAGKKINIDEKLISNKRDLDYIKYVEDKGELSPILSHSVDPEILKNVAIAPFRRWRKSSFSIFEKYTFGSVVSIVFIVVIWFMTINEQNIRVQSIALSDSVFSASQKQFKMIKTGIYEINKSQMSANVFSSFLSKIFDPWSTPKAITPPKPDLNSLASATSSTVIINNYNNYDSRTTALSSISFAQVRSYIDSEIGIKLQDLRNEFLSYNFIDKTFLTRQIDSIVGRNYSGGSSSSGISSSFDLSTLSATSPILYDNGTGIFSFDFANPNTWTGLQTFNYSSSTIYSSFITASSTNLQAGFLTLSTTTAGTLKTDANGVVWIDTSSGTAASSTLLSDINYWSGTNTFANLISFPYASSTYTSFTTASTTNLIINGESFNDLTGTGLSISGGSLTNAGLLSLQHSSGSSQTGAITLATSTTAISNDWGITNSGTTFTINIPSASGSVRGLLTSADFNTFNNKLSSYNAWTHPALGISATTSQLTVAGLLSTASSTISGDLRLPSLSQGFSYIGSTGRVNTIASSSVQLSWFNNDAGFLTSLSGAASSTLLSDTNAFSGNNTFSGATIFQNASTTIVGSLNIGGNATVTNATTTGSIYIGTGLSGAGLANCNPSSGKLVWNNGFFSCEADAGAGGGITSIGAQYSTPSTDAGQTFATSTPDTNIELVITTSGSVHTFDANWIGTLAANRGGTGISNPTAGGILLGTYDGGGWQQVATSSLNLTTLSFASNNISQWNNDSGYLTSLAGAASSTLLSDINYWSGTNTFANLISFPYASSTYTSFTTASTTNLIINGESFNDLTGTGLAISGNTLVTSNIPNASLQNSTISGIALGSNLADLTATDATLTFSGSYNGSTARTIGLNLGNANTWTANQTFNYSSSTIYSSFITASSTNLQAGFLTLSTTTAGTLKTNGSGLVWIDTSSGTSASSTLLGDFNTWSNTNNFTSKLSVGSSSPWGFLSVNANSLAAGTPQFVVGSSTATNFIVANNGNVGVGTVNPNSKVSVVGNIDASFGSDTTRIIGIGLDGSFNDGKTGIFRFADSFNQLETTYGDTIKGRSFHGWQFYNNLGEVARFGTSFNNPNSYFTSALGISTTTPYYNLTIASTTGSQLALSAGAGLTQTVFRNDGTNLYIATTTIAGTATTSISALEIALGGFGTTTIRGLNISGQATSTSNVGFNITNGCYAIGGTCLSTGGSGASTTLLADFNTFSGNNTFLGLLTNTYASSTYTSFTTASTTNLIINGESFNDLTGTGLAISGNTLVTSNIPNASLQNSTISGIALGSNLADLTATDATLTFSGSYNGSTARTIGLNLGNANTWTANQTFPGINVTNNQDLGTGINIYNNNVGALSRTQIILNNGSSAGYIMYNGTGYSGFGGPNALDIYNSAAAPIVFYTSAAERLRITGSGSVGISTTTPYYNLTIASTTGPQLSLSAGAGLAQWTFRNAGGNLYLSTTTVAGTATTTSSALTINGTTGGISLATSTVGTLKTTSNGLVWVDTSSGTSASSTLLSDFNTFTNTNNFTGKLGLATSTPFAKLSVNSIAGEAAFVVGSSTGTSLIVDASGNVGIGTAAPTAIFDISGNFKVSSVGIATALVGYTTSNNAIGLYNDGVNLANNIAIKFSSNAGQDGTKDLALYRNSAGLLEVNNGTNGVLAKLAASDIFVGTTTSNYNLTIASTTAPQLSLSAGAGLTQTVFRNDGTNLYIATTTIAGTATTSISALEIALGGFGTTTIRGLNISGQATSTSNVGFNITNGCYAINGSCVGGTGGSGTVNSGIFGQLAFYGADGSSVSGTSTIVVSTTTPQGRVGIATTTNLNATLTLQGASGLDILRIATSTSGNVFAVSEWGGLVQNVSSSTAVLIQDGYGGSVFSVDTTQSATNSGIDITAGGAQTGHLLGLYASNSSFLSGFNSVGGLIIGTSSATTKFAVATSSASYDSTMQVSFNSGGATTTIGFFVSTSTGLNAGSGMALPSALRNYVILGNGKVQAGMAIVNGGLCVDNDGWCTASTTGRISSVSSTVGGADIAEMYHSYDEMEAGDIVALAKPTTFIQVADPLSDKEKIFGIVSTDPGIILGMRPGDEKYSATESISNELKGIEGKDESEINNLINEIKPKTIYKYPIALAGRVPLKVSTENGNISVGDYLTLSSIKGVAMKATSPGQVIGQAMEDYSGSDVGKIIVFVKNTYYEGSQNNEEGEFLWNKIVGFFKNVGIEITNGIIKVANIITQKIVADKIETKELCIENLCVTKDQLQALLNQAGIEVINSFPIEEGEEEIDNGVDPNEQYISESESISETVEENNNEQDNNQNN